jgi:hypothetical protein
MDYWKKEVRKTDDVLDGTLPPSDFDHKLIERTYYTLTRPFISNTIFEFDGWPADGMGVSATGTPAIHFLRGTQARLVENDRMALELLSRTNPMRPTFSVPVYIKELAEIGSMFHFAAKSFAGFLGSSYLNYRFGWQQFLRDITTLDKIMGEISSRMQELQSLQKHGGLRRHINLEKRVNHAFIPSVITSSVYGHTARASMKATHRIRIHGSVRWTCSKDFADDIAELGELRKAIRLVFDLEAPDPETVWNMIPFSWLADYFINIGSWLGANAGGVDLVPNDVCIMRDYHARAVYTPLPPSSGTMTYQGRGTYNLRHRSRDVVYTLGPSFPSFRTDFLSWNQWKIIGALFASFRK